MESSTACSSWVTRIAYWKTPRFFAASIALSAGAVWAESLRAVSSSVVPAWFFNQDQAGPVRSEVDACDLVETESGVEGDHRVKVADR